jgi:hypothetical protein
MMSSLLEGLLIAMLMGSFLGVFYSWSEWRSQLRSHIIFGWRRAAVSIGLFFGYGSGHSVAGVMVANQPSSRLTSEMHVR